MITVVKSHFKSENFCSSKRYNLPTEKEIREVDFKFYQKILVVFISFSTFLIFPESPKELENICETHFSSKLCNVW